MNRDHLTPLVSAGTNGTGGTKPGNTGVRVVPVGESGPGPAGPLKTDKVFFGPGGPDAKTGTGTSKNRLKQGLVSVVPVVPPKNRGPGSVRDRDQADPVSRILSRLNLKPVRPPEPDFSAPAPADVERIRRIVPTWPQDFAQAWPDLVVSAMVAGRDQHEAERIAYRTLVRDAEALCSLRMNTIGGPTRAHLTAMVALSLAGRATGWR